MATAEHQAKSPAFRVRDSGPLRADHTATRPALAGDAEGSQGRLPRGGGICSGFRREWDGTFWQWSRGSQGKGARSEVGGGTVGQEPQMGGLGGAVTPPLPPVTWRPRPR